MKYLIQNKKLALVIFLSVSIIALVFFISTQAQAFALRSRIPIWCFLKIINCWPPPNQPPVANAGDDKVIIYSGSVILDGSGTDPDINDSIASYGWSCTGGTLSNSSIAKPTYTAITNSTLVDKTYTCTLTVKDTRGATASDDMIITVTPNFPPKGYHGSTTCNSILGWTCDQDDFSQPLLVHFYKDGPPGTGTIIGSTTANITREQAVADACGGNANHGFSFATPLSVKDGIAHDIYAYAINIPSGSGINPLLTLSPKTITCAAPVFTTLSLTKPDWCTTPFHILNWTLNTTQSAKRIKVSTDPNFPEDPTLTYDSGKISLNGSIQLYGLNSSTYPTGGPQYNKTYYWRVMAWNTETVPVPSAWSTVQSFTTPTQYPSPAFDPPINPKEKTSVQFVNKSTTYGGSPSWFWTFQDGTPSPSTSKDPLVVFGSSGNKVVTLKVCDSLPPLGEQERCCSTDDRTTNIGTKRNYRWIEVAPN